MTTVLSRRFCLQDMCEKKEGVEFFLSKLKNVLISFEGLIYELNNYDYECVYFDKECKHPEYHKDCRDCEILKTNKALMKKLNEIIAKIFPEYHNGEFFNAGDIIHFFPINETYRNEHTFIIDEDGQIAPLDYTIDEYGSTPYDLLDKISYRHPETGQIIDFNNYNKDDDLVFYFNDEENFLMTHRGFWEYFESI